MLLRAVGVGASLAERLRRRLVGLMVDVANRRLHQVLCMLTQEVDRGFVDPRSLAFSLLSCPGVLSCALDL